MSRTTLRPILVAAPTLWVAAVFGAAFIASRPVAGVAAYAFSAAVYEIGSIICHQLPERSFHLWGAQLAVCARCTGLYLGAAVAALAVTRIGGAAIDRQVWNRARELLVVAVAPTAITLIYERISGEMPSHWIRAVAGFPLGAIVMLVLLAATAPESAVEIH